MKIHRYFWLVFLLAMGACQTTSSTQSTFEPPFYQPPTPRFFIVVQGEKEFAYQWGADDKLHQGNISAIDSAFQHYVSLYKYPQLKVLIRGNITREGLNAFYEELSKRDILPYANLSEP